MRVVASFADEARANGKPKRERTARCTSNSGTYATSCITHRFIQKRLSRTHARRGQACDVLGIPIAILKNFFVVQIEESDSEVRSRGP